MNTENKQANELKIKKPKHIIEQIIKRTKLQNRSITMGLKKKKKKETLPMNMSFNELCIVKQT